MTEKERLIELLEQNHITPTKTKGQNFLLSQQVIFDMIDAVSWDDIQDVLEIGPGLGILTHVLLQYAPHVTCVELDNQIFTYLKNQFKTEEKLTLMHGDILQFDMSQLKTPYAVVANLPYQITSKILRFLLTQEKKPRQIIVMVQKEVAKRICETTGKHSLLSLSIQFFAKVRIIGHVSKEFFYPIPQVDSSIIEIYDIGQRSKQQEKVFFQYIKAGFSQKRKKLLSNLVNHGLLHREEGLSIFQEMGLDEGVRAQHISLEQWQQFIERKYPGIWEE